MSRPERLVILTAPMTGSCAMYWSRLNFNSTWICAGAAVPRKSKAARGTIHFIIERLEYRISVEKKDWRVEVLGGSGAPPHDDKVIPKPQDSRNIARRSARSTNVLERAESRSS